MVKVTIVQGEGTTSVDKNAKGDAIDTGKEARGDIGKKIKEVPPLKTAKEPKAGSERVDKNKERMKELLGELIEGVQKEKKECQEKIDSLKETEKTDKWLKWVTGGTAVGMGALTLYTALVDKSIAFASIALILTACSGFMWDLHRKSAPVTASNIKYYEGRLPNLDKEDKKWKTQLSELEKTDKTQSS